MNMIWFVRAAKWVRRPPSERRIKFIAAILAACALLYGIELIWGWPEWLTPDRVRPGRIQ